MTEPGTNEYYLSAYGEIERQLSAAGPRTDKDTYLYAIVAKQANAALTGMLVEEADADAIMAIPIASDDNMSHILESEFLSIVAFTTPGLVATAIRFGAYAGLSGSTNVEIMMFNNTSGCMYAYVRDLGTGQVNSSVIDISSDEFITNTPGRLLALFSETPYYMIEHNFEEYEKLRDQVVSTFSEFYAAE
jgi:hypothetical protein